VKKVEKKAAVFYDGISMKHRYLEDAIRKDLLEKMVFLGGPRQVGKTTLSMDVLGADIDSLYFNWDNDKDRKSILAAHWPGERHLLIFDEIHKYARWKNWIKGQYDKFKSDHQFLVTGSAKLNVYRKKGDSLLGRYHYYCLHPFSLQECLTEGRFPSFSDTDLFKDLTFRPASDAGLQFERLLTYGGFPEPYTKKSRLGLRRWHNDRLDLLVKDDIRSLEDVREVSVLMLLAQLLSQRVGSPLSVNALREELEVSHKAVSRWLTILEMVYYCYRIYPYHRSVARAVKKEPKLYLWDWSEVENPGAGFENMIAGHLHKFVDFLRHCYGYRAELYYLRTLEKKEVDFLVVVDGKPWFAVEAKLSDDTPSKALSYFQDRLHIPFVYQVLRTTGIDYRSNNTRVISAEKFLTALI
jgi:predicted AAA+ superfamily ATPase